MKKIVLVLLLSYSITCGYSQSLDSIPDRVLTTIFTKNEYNPGVKQIDANYGRGSKPVYQYDEDGFLKNSKIYNRSKLWPVSNGDYEFYLSGDTIIKKETYSKSEIFIIKYLYDSIAKTITGEISYWPIQNKIINICTDYIYQDFLLIEYNNGQYKITNTYNDKGLLTNSKSVGIVSGSLSTEISEYTYDKNDRLIFMSRTICSIDDDGNIHYPIYLGVPNYTDKDGVNSVRIEYMNFTKQGDHTKFDYITRYGYKLGATRKIKYYD